MKSIEELIDKDDPGIDFVRELLSTSEVPCLELPPADCRADALVRMQITTRSPIGAILYETGGLLMDGGWIRVLGSGHPQLPRTLHEWSHGRASGYLLIADDALGGFFAINGGAFGDDKGSIYYWGPDCIEWEPLDIVYSQFLAWCTSDQLADFYAGLRWSKWREELATLTGEQCFAFYPPLWSGEGTVEKSDRWALPVIEAFDLKVELLSQFVDDE